MKEGDLREPNTELCRRMLGRNIGQLREGFESDISVLSLSDPNMIPCYDPYSVLVYSAQPQNVTDVYIKGKTMLENGKFTFSFSDMVSSFNEAASGFRRGGEASLMILCSHEYL